MWSILFTLCLYEWLDGWVDACIFVQCSSRVDKHNETLYMLVLAQFRKAQDWLNIIPSYNLRNVIDGAPKHIEPYTKWPSF